MEMLAAKTHCFFSSYSTPKVGQIVITERHAANVSLEAFNWKYLSLKIGNRDYQVPRSSISKAVQAVVSGTEPGDCTKFIVDRIPNQDVVFEVYYQIVEAFTFKSNFVDGVDELKMRVAVEASGAKTQEIYDKVFSKMVDDAQPIPGFRRVKGGKTPNIPQNILLEILGPSKVYEKVIRTIINSSIAQYVSKEGLAIGKDLHIEQSFQDLESVFEPGQTFRFDAIVQCKDMKSAKVEN